MMIRTNEELVATKVRLAIVKGGMLMAPLVAMVLAVWIYTQRWTVGDSVSSGMEWAVIGVNTASILLAIYVGTFIVMGVSNRLISELSKEGLLGEGVHMVSEPEPTEVILASGILDGVDQITSFDPVQVGKDGVDHYRAKKAEAKVITLEKVDS